MQKRKKCLRRTGCGSQMASVSLLLQKVPSKLSSRSKYEVVDAQKTRMPLDNKCYCSSSRLEEHVIGDSNCPTAVTPTTTCLEGDKVFSTVPRQFRLSRSTKSNLRYSRCHKSQPFSPYSVTFQLLPFCAFSSHLVSSSTLLLNHGGRCAGIQSIPSILGIHLPPTCFRIPFQCNCLRKFADSSLRSMNTLSRASMLAPRPPTPCNVPL